MSTTTPMLRSQTSTVLTPQWISTLGPSNSSLHATHHQLPPPASTTHSNASFPQQPPAYSPSSTTSTTTAHQSPGAATTSPSTLPPPPPPPPPAYGGAPSNNNSMVTRSPFFGSVGVSQTAGRSTLSAGLASWRNAGPTTNSPGVSPSLGPSVIGSSPPPPPPSYSATVTTVSGTSNQSKKATLFCEIADQVYTRIVNESRYSVGGAVAVPVAATATTTAKESAAVSRLPCPASATAAAAAEKAEKEKEAEKIGKYLNVIRVAGLGDDGKSKISSAVTLACQTSLSEPSGRFFVFELPPVSAELWPSHTPIQSGVESRTNTPITEFEPNSAFGPSSKKQHDQDTNHNESSSSLPLPPSEEESIWLKSRVCCVACPDQHLMQSLFTKLQEVFGSREGVKLDFVQRNLPLSCCLVIKASNSANKNHEAEIVPWGDLMEIGAEITVTTNCKESGEFVGDGGMMLPNASSSADGGPPNRSASSPNTAKPSNVAAFPLPSYQDSVANKTTSTGETTKEEKHYVPAPFIPSYFRLLRNERGVFRNALFLRFKSQAKAEISMMYLERLNLCGRRIRVEHKKQSRSSIVKDTNTPTVPAAPVTTPSNPFSTTTSTTTTAGISNSEIMEANINDLLRRYDRDGFSYPKRLLTDKDLKFLTDLVAAHDLTLETGNTTVSVIRPRKSGASSSLPPAASSALANKQVSPALGSSTPPWAPQTPPLPPKNYHANPNINNNHNTNSNSNGLTNSSFSEKLESGTMTFRGLRHWKEQRATAENGGKEATNNNTKKEIVGASSSSSTSHHNHNHHHEDELSGLPPAMSLDSGSATSKYVRCLDWQEAQKQGIAAWGTGRGRPVRT